jgi:methylmalonyl-CoA mutase N-terminal domain/subunit
MRSRGNLFGWRGLIPSGGEGIPRSEDDIAEAEARWRRTTLKRSLEAVPDREEAFRTSSHVPVKRVYTPLDLGDVPYEERLGYPGEPPFTRGVYPTMYRGRLWTMRQYAGYGTAEESNRRYRMLLARGQTGLSVAFDLPTQMGYDSDHPAAEGEVGRAGVAVSSLDDMRRLLDGLPLDRVSTSMTINATAVVLLAFYVAVAEEGGVPPDRLRGTVQNDILKEFVARHTYIYPPGPSMRLVVDIFEHCARYMPLWNAISVSGYHIREAGATAAQEVGFTLAHAIAYVEAALARGLDLDAFAPRLSFFFVAQNDVLEEVAKFRAARRLWARIMKDRFHAATPESMMLRFHTQTAGVALTAQQPENNVVRVAYQALAGILGGTQSLHTNSMDEALGLPSERAATLALRTQQILAHESGVVNTVDPVAGSYYIEWLTDEIEGEAKALIEKVDAMGGVLAAIERGWIQREIAESAYRVQRDIESGRRLVVGVNAFRTEEPTEIEVLAVPEAIEERRRQRLAAWRQGRDGAAVERALGALHRGAEGEANLMPLVLAAAKAGATLGEISDALREAFGTYRPKEAI